MNEKILIVDDTADIRELLLEALQMAGYVVCEAANGTEALRKIKTESPDLVILDIAMPDISGFQVLREMRKTSKTPVIMLSAMAETTDKVESLQLGADDYMTKPFQIAEMTARIEAVLRRTTMSNSVPEKIDFNDSNMGRTFKAHASVKVYLSYFDPEGPAIVPANAAAIRSSIPILWIVGKKDPATRPSSYAFDKAPTNPKSKYLAVDAGHLDTPDVAADQIILWIADLWKK